MQNKNRKIISYSSFHFSLVLKFLTIILSSLCLYIFITRKHLELISTFRKEAGYKIIGKLKAILYINNKETRKEIWKTKTLKIAFKIH